MIEYLTQIKMERNDQEVWRSKNATAFLNYESNYGNDVFFQATIEDAINKLCKLG